MRTSEAQDTRAGTARNAEAPTDDAGLAPASLPFEKERMTRLAPLLSVRRGVEAVAFYKTAFGAVETFRVEHEGAIVATLSIDGADFWVADEAPDHAAFSPESAAGPTARMILMVDDPDAAVDRAVAAGATIVWPVDDRYGWRLGRVVDPFGHHWEIGRPLAKG